MKKSIILILIAMLSLVGCSSFYFGCIVKQENSKTQKKTLDNIHLGMREVGDFRRRTAPNYQKIVMNNRQILSIAVIEYDRYKSENWFIAQPYIEEFIYEDIKDIINPQKDAQRYINLLLSLVSDTMKYQAIVLETNNDAPYYPGEYIFISRKEIESCQDEAELAEILSFRLVRNDYLNLNAEFSKLDKKNINESLLTIIQKAKENWNNYAHDSSNILNPEVSDKVATIMIRAGFKPSFPYSLETLTDYHPTQIDSNISLSFITPLLRHRKVFD